MSAYLSGWYPPLAAVAREYALMTSRAADDLEPLILREASEPSASAQQLLQGRQCRLRCISLLCYDPLVPGAIVASDAAAIIRLMVL